MCRRAKPKVHSYFPESNIRITNFLTNQFSPPLLHPSVRTLTKTLLKLTIKRAFRNTTQTCKFFHGFHILIIIQFKYMTKIYILLIVM